MYTYICIHLHIHTHVYTNIQTFVRALARARSLYTQTHIHGGARSGGSIPPPPSNNKMPQAIGVICTPNNPPVGVRAS